MVKWDFKVDKPIFMILHGHSVKCLIKRWNEFKDLDVLWFSMNHCKYLGEFMKFPLDVYIWYCTHKNCNKHNYKHVFSESEGRGNSPFEFLLQANENGVKDLVFFGMDGYTPNPEAVYADGTFDAMASDAHPRECGYFNANYPKDLNVRVYNAVTKETPSNYTCMKSMTYDEILAHFPNKKSNQESNKKATINDAVSVLEEYGQ